MSVYLVRMSISINSNIGILIPFFCFLIISDLTKIIEINYSFTKLGFPVLYKND